MSAASPVVPTQHEETVVASAAAVKAPRRFFELDSLRGLAAATVVLHHFNYLLPALWYHRMVSGPFRLLVNGHAAVMLFFVLSGFVLTLPYMRRTGLDYPGFLIKRICRIYLPYLAALALALIADRFSPHLTRAVAELPAANVWIAQTWSEPISFHKVFQHVLFIGTYDTPQFNTAFWSLVYEMRISLVFPLIAWAVLRWRMLTSVITAFALWIASVVFNRVIPGLLHLNASAVADQGDTLFYAAIFILGAMLARYLATADAWFLRLRNWQVGLLAVVSIIFYSYAAPTHPVRHIPPGLFDVLTALGSLGFILLAINCGPAQRFLTSRLIHHLGKVSYSLYLVHGTVLFVLIHTLVGRIPLAAVFAIYLSLTVALTEIFYRVIEHPTMLLGRRLTATRTGSGSASRHL